MRTDATALLARAILTGRTVAERLALWSAHKTSLLGDPGFFIYRLANCRQVD
jgi:hypothetical protein